MSKIIIGEQPAQSYLQYDDVTNNLYLNKIGSSTQINNKDYTAYDVFPNSISYAVNDVIGSIPFADNNTESYLSGKTVHVAIPANNIQKVNIRSYDNVDTIDVVIDWGDGSRTKLSEANTDSNITLFQTKSNDVPPTQLTEYRYLVQHEYIETDKVYTVKIYGKKYWNVYHLFADFSGILCGCLGNRLPIASHINNLAGFAGRSLRLFHVELSEYVQNAQIVSLGNTFLYCQNLQYAIGFGKLSSNLYQTQQCFSNCENMVFCDLRIPGNAIMSPIKNPYKATYAYCRKLTGDVLDLLPVNGFIGKQAVFGGLFNTCPKLTCSDYEKLDAMLWNNPNLQWVDYKVSTAVNLASFRGCSAELRKHVPVSWGGTASDDIINQKTTKK